MNIVKNLKLLLTVILSFLFTIPGMLGKIFGLDFFQSMMLIAMGAIIGLIGLRE